eukprot:TRINITY_DN26934_c0_g1_i1.p1 TRINITY_DN26934_c0_g1~~TRINITY_DN26934_c0_g1_i1.p1  ORF type:complete len:549 (+),score=99.19 TRINITY_DN26934_c0_g1_i1:57-1703(+)
MQLRGVVTALFGAAAVLSIGMALRGSDQPPVVPPLASGVSAPAPAGLPPASRPPERTAAVSWPRMPALPASGGWVPPAVPAAPCSPLRCGSIGPATLHRGTWYTPSVNANTTWPSPAADAIIPGTSSHWWPDVLRVTLRPQAAQPPLEEEPVVGKVALVQPPVAAACFVNLWHTLDHAIVLHSAAANVSRVTGEVPDLITWGCAESGLAGRYDGGLSCSTLECAETRPLFTFIAAPFRKVVFAADVARPLSYDRVFFGVSDGCSLHQSASDKRSPEGHCAGNMWGFRNALLRRVFPELAPDVALRGHVDVRSAECPYVAYFGRGEGNTTFRRRGVKMNAGTLRNSLSSSSRASKSVGNRFRKLHNLAHVMTEIARDLPSCSPDPRVLQLSGSLRSQLAEVNAVHIAVAARGAATSWVAWLPVNAGYLSLDGVYDGKQDDWHPYQGLTPTWTHWRRAGVRMVHHADAGLPPDTFRRYNCPLKTMNKPGGKRFARGRSAALLAGKKVCATGMYADANRCGLWVDNTTEIVTRIRDLSAHMQRTAAEWGLK